MTQTPGSTCHFPRFVHSLLIAGIFFGLTAANDTASAQTGQPIAAPAPSASAAPVPAPAAAPNPTPAPAAATAPAAAPAPAAATAPAAAPAPAATTAPVAAPAPQSEPPAPPTPEELQLAAAALEVGKAAYAQGAFDQAETGFARAYELGRTIEAQYWLALALDLQGKSARAVETFEQVVARPEFASLESAAQQTAQARLSVLRQIPATVTVQLAPKEATLSIDGQLQTGAMPLVVKLAAGKHSLSAIADGYAGQTVDLDVRAAAEQEVVLSLEALPPPPEPAAVAAETPVEAPPAAATEPPSRLPAYVTLGVAGASAIVGTVFGFQALNAKDDFDKKPTLANADDVERSALIADMAFGVGLTLGITGIVLLVTDEPTQQTASSTQGRSKLAITPYVGLKSAGAAAQLTF